MSPDTIKGEPRFKPGTMIQTPFWANPVTVEEYDVNNGAYEISGPDGSNYRLVIIESGYKRLYPHALDWEYERGHCEFEEIQAV
jgi:hypothetical protein